MSEKLHLTKQEYSITKNDRIKLNKHNSIVVWFSGLSGSGKSTIANEIETRLFKLNFRTYILDGDNVRNGLNSDLSFSENDRTENIRRVAEVSKLLLEAGTIVLSAFISPYEKDRNLAKHCIGAENFVEVFVDCPVEVCESRDIKGLYKKARLGEISNFTGISSPFETPTNPNIIVHTNKESIEQCCEKILAYILPKIILHE